MRGGRRTSEVSDILRRGESLTHDPRVEKFRNRERLLMTVYDPDRDFMGPRHFASLAFVYSRRVLTKFYFWGLLLFFVVPFIACSLDESANLSPANAGDAGVGLCYGPDRWKYADYFPAIVNSFTTFLLVFFTSHNYERYRSLYHSMVDLRTSLSAVVVLGVASIGSYPDSTARSLELWRCANLVNLLSFHSIDPVLYSLEDFVFPVAEAFGAASGGGMLPEEEVKRLRKLSRRALESSGAFINKGRRELTLGSDESQEELRLQEVKVNWGCVRDGAMAVIEGTGAAAQLVGAAAQQTADLFSASAAPGSTEVAPTPRTQDRAQQSYGLPPIGCKKGRTFVKSDKPA